MNNIYDHYEEFADEIENIRDIINKKRNNINNIKTNTIDNTKTNTKPIKKEKQDDVFDSLIEDNNDLRNYINSKR